MAARIDGQGAQRAWWASTFDEHGGLNSERCCLFTSDGHRHPIHGHLVSIVIFSGVDAVEHQGDGLGILVNGNAHVAEGEVGLVLIFQGQIIWQVLRAAHLLHDVREVGGNGGDLHFLNLDGDELTTLAHLQQEGSLSNSTDGADGEALGFCEDVVGHDGTTSVRDAVEFTESTMAPSVVIMSVVIEHGETTSRWN